jgi:hypothetical protein
MPFRRHAHECACSSSITSALSSKRTIPLQNLSSGLVTHGNIVPMALSDMESHLHLARPSRAVRISAHHNHVRAGRECRGCARFRQVHSTSDPEEEGHLRWNADVTKRSARRVNPVAHARDNGARADAGPIFGLRDHFSDASWDKPRAAHSAANTTGEIGNGTEAIVAETAHRRNGTGAG